MPSSNMVPDAALAGQLAQEATGQRPARIGRFGTGSHHHVFEVAFAGRPPIVVRLNTAEGGAAMAGGVALSRRLRPLGVPLPALLAEGSVPLPHMVLERLPGTDLGHVAAGMTGPRLDAVAAGIARAQAIVARLPQAGRYGYAVEPADAPHARWSDVLRANLARSQGRIATTGLFDPHPVDRAARLVERAADRLDRQPPVPFLHDTTTKNVIVAPDGSLSGIVDVDDLCFGDPRYPAALTLASLTVSGGPVRYVEAWMDAAGLVDDPLFRLYVVLFLVDFMSEHGQHFNGNQRASEPAARRRLLGTFEAALPLADGA